MRGFRLRLHPSQKRQLRKVERSHPSPRVRYRARLLLACAKEKSLLKVAKDFDCAWSTVKETVSRYLKGGVKTLADAPRQGRPRRVNAEVRAALVNALEMTPKAAGMGGFVWTVGRVRRYLRHKHKIKVATGTAWKEIDRCRRRRKRGKGYVDLPDPLYEKKKGT